MQGGQGRTEFESLAEDELRKSNAEILDKLDEVEGLLDKNKRRKEAKTNREQFHTAAVNGDRKIQIF